MLHGHCMRYEPEGVQKKQGQLYISPQRRSGESHCVIGVGQTGPGAYRRRHAALVERGRRVTQQQSYRRDVAPLLAECPCDDGGTDRITYVYERTPTERRK